MFLLLWGKKVSWTRILLLDELEHLFKRSSSKKRFWEKFIFRELISLLRRRIKWVTFIMQLESGFGNCAAIYPSVTSWEWELQHILGVDFLQGHVYVVDEAQAAWKASDGSIRLRINEVKLTQSFNAHFIEVQAVQTVALNMSNPECCQLNVSYTSGMPGSLLTGRK